MISLIIDLPITNSLRFAFLAVRAKNFFQAFMAEKKIISSAYVITRA